MDLIFSSGQYKLLREMYEGVCTCLNEWQHPAFFVALGDVNTFDLDTSLLQLLILS